MHCNCSYCCDSCNSVTEVADVIVLAAVTPVTEVADVIVLVAVTPVTEVADVIVLATTCDQGWECAHSLTRSFAQIK